MLLKTDRFNLEGREIDFDLVRKKSVRRNILVRFEDNGRMQVTAPLRSSTKTIHLVLSDMHDQIVELRQQVRERNRGISPTRYRQWAQHSYLGRNYVLDIQRDANLQPEVTLRTDRIEVHVREWGEDAVRDALLGWYRTRQQHPLAARCSIPIAPAAHEAQLGHLLYLRVDHAQSPVDESSAAICRLCDCTRVMPLART